MAEKKNNLKSAAAPKAASGGKSKTPAKSAGSGKKEKSLGDLVSALAEKTGVTKAKAREFLDAHAALLVDELKQNGSVQLAGIGKLKLGMRAARQGRNPATGAAITIKASKTVKFSGGKAFKDGFQ
ncbi:MAG: HU family DNA-binding protein [Pyrinomonadaceae bacterium]